MQSLQLHPFGKPPPHFSSLSINSGKQRINDLLEKYKDKLNFNRTSVRIPPADPVVGCSLNQAKHIEQLSKTLPRRSFHQLISTF